MAKTARQKKGFGAFSVNEMRGHGKSSDRSRKTKSKMRHVAKKSGLKAPGSATS